MMILSVVVITLINNMTLISVIGDGDDDADDDGLVSNYVIVKVDDDLMLHASNNQLHPVMISTITMIQ